MPEAALLTGLHGAGWRRQRIPSRDTGLTRGMLSLGGGQ